MKMNRIVTTVLPGTWWLADKIAERKRKRRAKQDSDVIDNLERLHRLLERGSINEKDFEELKEKLKAQF